MVIIIRPYKAKKEPTHSNSIPYCAMIDSTQTAFMNFMLQEHILLMFLLL